MEEKEQLIKMIKSRIESEFRKHPSLDWAELAARKIASEIDFVYDIAKKEKKE